MSLLARGVLLVVIWVLAWGSVTAANVVVGAVLAAVLLLAFPPTDATARFRLRFRPVAASRLVIYLLGQLVTSNVLIAREILSPRSRIRTGVIVHEIPSSSDWVLTLVANAIALTPGAMTVEATSNPSVLHVHFLLLHDEAMARRRLDRLTSLVIAVAVPDDAATAADPRRVDPTPGGDR
jgi:multicomponent Na+:H+ antiporter subunit E